MDEMLNEVVSSEDLKVNSNVLCNEFFVLIVCLIDLKAILPRPYSALISHVKSKVISTLDWAFSDFNVMFFNHGLSISCVV